MMVLFTLKRPITVKLVTFGYNTFVETSSLDKTRKGSNYSDENALYSIMHLRYVAELFMHS